MLVIRTKEYIQTTRNLLYRRNVCFMLYLFMRRKTHIPQAMADSQNFCIKESLIKRTSVEIFLEMWINYFEGGVPCGFQNRKINIRNR